MKGFIVGLLLILAASEGKCLAQEPGPPPLGQYEYPWGGAEYLLWWVRKGGVPPLVVTGSPADTVPGALDQPGTRVLFGNNGLDYGTFNGLRLDLGIWLDDGRSFGVEGGGFALQHRSVQFSAQGDANGQPFLAAPFVNALTGKDSVYLISQNFADPALAALLTGGVNVQSSTNLLSWEINGLANLVRDNDWSVNVLAGFRQAYLREDLSYVTMSSNIAPGGVSSFLVTPIDPSASVTTYDAFGTQNRFNGGQIGARLDRHWGPLTLVVVGKLALGSMHEVVSIQGQTSTTAPLVVTQAVGGIYAQGSNIGTYHRDVFAVIPEIGANLSLDLTSNIRARIGYTFLCLSNVVRPGDQIDTRINPNQVPIDAAFGTSGGPNRPAFDFKAAPFWAQGMNLGLEFRF